MVSNGFECELYFTYSFPRLILYLGFLLQYGPIAHIDLKIPPRPPGYAFVEVSLISFKKSIFIRVCFDLS